MEYKIGKKLSKNWEAPRWLGSALSFTLSAQGLGCLLLTTLFFVIYSLARDMSNDAGMNDINSISSVMGDGMAIIVLGGGLNKDASPPSWQRERCRVAAELYHEKKQKARISPRVITLSGGTPWKPPPRDARGFPITEAAASAKYLATGLEPAHIRVPYEDIMEEAFSLDTIGNAYFLRTMHTDPGRLRSLAVVTSEFHMPRARFIFEWVFSLPPVVGAKALDYTLAFHIAPNAGMDVSTVRLRKEKEAASLNNLPDTTVRIRSLEQLHRFMYDEHKTYGAFRHAKQVTEIIDPKILETY